MTAFSIFKSLLIYSWMWYLFTVCFPKWHVNLYFLYNNECILYKTTVARCHQSASQNKLTWEPWLQSRRLISSLIITVFVETSCNYFCFCWANGICFSILAAYVASIPEPCRISGCKTPQHPICIPDFPLAVGAIFPASCIILHLFSGFAAFNCWNLPFLFLTS
jgi:hypothetical protein